MGENVGLCDEEAVVGALVVMTVKLMKEMMVCIIDVLFAQVALELARSLQLELG